MADRGGLDLMLGDMAAHQTRFQGETTPDANQALAARALERLDQKQAEADGRPKYEKMGPAPIPTAPPAQAAAEAAKRGFKLVRLPSDPGENLVAPVTGRALAMYRGIRERVLLLLTKRESGPLGQPSWRDRVLAIQADHYDVKCGRTLKERKAHAARRMLNLVEESSATFGPWWAEKPKRVQVG